MEDIFKLLNKDDNTRFSSLKGCDLKDIINALMNYEMEYRNSLNLPEKMTFGCEIEVENITKKPEFDNNLSKWIVKPDITLEKGCEVTSPIMCDEKKWWNDLRKVCSILKNQKRINFINSGGHVHVGAHILKYDYVSLLKFLKMIINYENILFHFSAGIDTAVRREGGTYAKPIASKLLNIVPYDDGYTYNSLINELKRMGRFLSVNFLNVKLQGVNNSDRNTIEFRMPNGTVEEVIWQNNINAFCKMLFVATTEIDENILNNYDNNISDSMYYYNIIDLKKSIEFVDLIFNNNLDKINFLVQYFKGFNDIYDTNASVYSKKIIK